jgi:dehydrogenase/reductase SDR family protein 1
VGRGIALGLGEAGWTVYVTARTVRDGDSDRPGSTTSTAQEVTRLGGRGIAVPCDHRVDAETERAFRRVVEEQGRLDLLVNNAASYSTDVGPPEDSKFWEQPLAIWDDMHAVGLRAAFVASAIGVRTMIARGRGVIVNVSSLGAIRYTGNVSYNVVKAGVDMLTLAMAEELRERGIAVVSVWPRLTRTEGVLAHPDMFPNAAQAWTPQFNGRLVAALAADPDVMARSGQSFDVGTLASDYGIDDVDGRRPARRALERALRHS